MSATVEQAPEQDAPEEAPESINISRANAQQMFRWSAYLHVGEGAEECSCREEVEGGAIVGVGCENPAHFHAWVRLPNQYQHREIVQKSSAAQARKQRAYADDSTDSSVILDAEMDELRSAGVKGSVVEALLSKDSTKNHLEAMGEVRQREEFEHLAHDQERLNELERMPQDERPTEEYDQLREHLEKFMAEVETARKVKRDEQQGALSQLELEDLVVQLRSHRVEQEAMEEYLHMFGTWEIIAGCFKVERDPSLRKHTVRHFTSVAELTEWPPEVIDGVKGTLDDLRVAQQEAVTEGNS